ncbi:MAG: GNAT family N-acetyltransferase [Solirubrobacterales bacterium]|nr:GNAT family N-acetyltransferase [Solirubrobacterales bacterium]
MTLALDRDQIQIRRRLRPGDTRAIAELHRRVYGAEYGMSDDFVAAVAATLEQAVASGWPQDAGAVWIVEQDGRTCGSLALTAEDERRGQLRWFVFEAALRGRGLGRSLLSELLATARDAGMQRLELDTFSALDTAARLYRGVGFEVVSERGRSDWGPRIVYQHYTLAL